MKRFLIAFSIVSSLFTVMPALALPMITEDGIVLVDIGTEEHPFPFKFVVHRDSEDPNLYYLGGTSRFLMLNLNAQNFGVKYSEESGPELRIHYNLHWFRMPSELIQNGLQRDTNPLARVINIYDNGDLLQDVSIRERNGYSGAQSCSFDGEQLICSARFSGQQAKDIRNQILQKGVFTNHMIHWPIVSIAAICNPSKWCRAVNDETYRDETRTLFAVKISSAPTLFEL